MYLVQPNKTIANCVLYWYDILREKYKDKFNKTTISMSSMDSSYRNKCAFLSTKVIIADISILMCILVVNAMDLSIIFFAGVLSDSVPQSLSCYRTGIKCAILQYN